MYLESEDNMQLKDNTKKTEERKNRFNGESVMLTAEEARRHDNIFINELAATLEDKAAASMARLKNGTRSVRISTGSGSTTPALTWYYLTSPEQGPQGPSSTGVGPPVKVQASSLKPASLTGYKLYVIRFYRR